MATIEMILSETEKRKAAAKARKLALLNEQKEILEKGKAEGRDSLYSPEATRLDYLRGQVSQIDNELVEIKGRLAQINKIADEEKRAYELASTPDPARRTAKPQYDEVARIGSEPRTYTREADAKGERFLADVVNAYRGEPTAVERLARHQREFRVDNPMMERAAGDVTTSALPNLVIPSYLVTEYAAKPSAARPFADICRHVDLPAEGMTVELAKGNTSATAALQTSELVAAGGGNYDADPLQLSVQTAEAWQLVSRQAIERGRVTEQVVIEDMLDQMHALIDSTLITQATTGLYDSGTRITYDSASPTMAEMYPLILQGASKITQTLLNRGKATHVLMHPRRWFWLQSLVAATWPQITQPGTNPEAYGINTGNAYDDGIAGLLPCGLKVVMDSNVQTTALAGAQTGGTQDIIYIVPENECVLLEAPNREVFIRAEAPAAPQLGIMLVFYEFFSYTFQRYAATAMQRINGTGTAPPSGF